MNPVPTFSASATCSTVAMATSNNLSALVVFDGRLEDLATLYEALLPGVAGFTIDASADALVEITRLLAETGAKNLSIVAHGEPGVVHIGSQPLDLAQINRRSGLLQEWCVEEISVYSCEVGANIEFVHQLELVTGARVAAASTKVGSPLLGGNWNLDVATKEVIAPFTLPQVMAYAHTLVIGTNSFGYVADATTYQPINLVPGNSGVTSVLTSDDDQFVTVGLGSNYFNFYGTTYNQLFIGANGLINFGNSQAGASVTNQPLSINSVSYNKDAIAVFWDDLVTNQTTADQVLYSIQGNQLIVEWNEVEFFNDETNTNTITFQAILELNTALVPGDIKFNYVDLDTGNSTYSNGASATIGIRRASGDPLSVSFNSTNTNVGSGQAILFSIPVPTVVAPSAFTVTEDVAGNLAFVGTPFADIDSSSLTVTLAIADGRIAALAGTGVTLGGAATARTFSGTTTDLNTYFTTVGKISYTTALNNNIARTLDISVSDGVYSSSTTSTINITAVNDYAPIPILANVSLTAIAEDAVSPDGATVDSLFGSAFSDADGVGVDGSFFGIAITGNTSLPDQGTWEWLDGTDWTEITGVATTGALVLDKNTLIRFSPAADYNGTPGALTARLIDSSTTLVSGTGGHPVNGAVGVNSGGATAISRSAVTLTTSVTAVNDAPTLTVNLSPAANAQNYTEGGATSNGLFVNAQANTHTLGNNTEATQKFKSVTLEVTNLFAGDQLKIDGALVNIDATTTSSIVAGTFAVDVTVADGISQVTISRPTLDISNANLQTVIEGIGFNSTSDNPTDFGTKTTREITIVNITDNGGTPDSDSTTLSFLGTVTVHDVNDLAVLTDDLDAATEGSAPINATGNVLTNDIDPDNILTVSKVGGTAISAATVIAGTYGSLTIDTTGAYTYAADNSNTLVNSLNVGSASLTESFVYTVVEGGSTHTATLKIDIKGGNNFAVISGAVDGSIDESATVITGTTTTGTLISTDVDNISDWTASSGETTYGSYELDSLGAWTYTLDNEISAVNQLNVGDSLSDSFIVETVDGTTQTVTVTINGQNDAAIIAGTLSGEVTEQSGLNNATPGTGYNNFSFETPILVGETTVYDVDNDPHLIGTFDGNLSSFVSTSNDYGSYATDNANYWGYYINENNATVQGLNVGQSITDSFVVSAVDGTTQSVSIIIQGANDAAEISGDISGTATESGGLDNAEPGTSANGNLDAYDVDNSIEGSSDLWNEATEVVSDNEYGTYSINSDGAWTYVVNDDDPTIQALNNGDSTTDTFTVTTIDGTSQTVSVTINGQNDAAIITGDAAGSITESGTIPAGTSITGTLVSTDVDNTSNWTATSGTATYGSYGLDSLGAWTYTIDNGNTSVDALNVGGSLVDTFTVTTVDGTSQTVSVTINGADDASILSSSSTFTGSLTEASGLNNSINNNLASSQATGQVIYTDVDNTIVWNTTSKKVTSSQKGSYSVDANGNWVYNLNNNYGTVQKLHAGQSTTDTFTISTTSGLTQTVTVVIQGGEDTPVVTNPVALSGSVIEAGGENFDDRRFFGHEESSSIPGIPTVSKDVNFKDPDNTSDVWTPNRSSASYGNYSVNAAGKWTYNLDNYSRAVQSLNDGQTLTDTFKIVTNDGTSETVTITINGTNDAAYIYHEDDYHYVVEDGGVANGSAGRPTATGDLDNFDFDNTLDSWTVQESVVSIGGYGTYSIDASGEWAYTLDNTNPDVESLIGDWWDENAYLTDTFVVQTIDGTSHTVTVGIYGQDDDAVITGDINQSITEASGFDNSVGSSVQTGTLAYTDVDNDPADGWWAESEMSGQYGTYDITSEGVWTYTLNNNNGDVDGLQDGETLIDSFTVYTAAGTTQAVTLTIVGANDSAVITGPTTAEFTEDDEVTSTIGNNLNYTDPDNIEDGWQAVDTPALSDGEYGNYTIDADGVWSYSLNDAKVQTIGGGETVIDTFTATATDGTTQTISVTINGVNDAAILSSDDVYLDETDAALTANGTLTISDVDNPATFEVLTDVAGDNGSFSIDATGAWTYTANSAFDSLNVEDSIADVFTVTAADGTTSSVTVTINGTNDAPVLSVALPTVLPIGNINSPYAIDLDTLLAGYIDVDGGTLSVTDLSADGGSIDGNIFTPDEDFTGTVNLTYDVADGNGGTANGAKSFTIGEIKETVGNLQLAIVNGQYMAVDPTTHAINNITYGGVNVGPNSFNNWLIIATERTTNNANNASMVFIPGSEIQSLWKHKNGQYWYNTNTDNGGLVEDVTLYEANFKQDFNGDRVIGPSLESAGTTTLSLNSSGNYIATNDSVVLNLTYSGADTNPNTFNGWQVAGAEIAGSDVKAVWKSTGGQFWYSTNTDNGGIVEDITPYEADFSQDFNGDGVIGEIPVTLIEAAGTTTLSINGSGKYVANKGNGDVNLLYAGSTFGASTFGTWQVVGAEIAGSEVQAVWKNTDNQYWYSTNTDNGGIVADVETYEFSFHQDFNQDGFISQIGTAGNDVLGGSSANDRLTGGAGTDTFILKASNNGIDYITDFQSSEFLAVSSFGLASVNLLTVTGSGTPTGNGSNQFIFNSDNGDLYFDGGSAVKLATLQGVSSLSASNFLLGVG